MLAVVLWRVDAPWRSVIDYRSSEGQRLRLQSRRNDSPQSPSALTIVHCHMAVSRHTRRYPPIAPEAGRLRPFGDGHPSGRL